MIWFNELPSVTSLISLQKHANIILEIKNFYKHVLANISKRRFHRYARYTKQCTLLVIPSSSM